MIVLVTKENRRQYAAQLRQMYQQRYQVFVEMLNWDLPLAKDGLEMDQYDTSDTLYLLKLDHNGEVLGSKRMNPTMRPHLMVDLFSHLVEGAVPRGRNIWESSRSCVPPSQQDQGIIGELFLGMAEAALIFHITRITFVVGMKFYPTVLHAGWGITPLGIPHKDDNGEELIAGMLIINPNSLNMMRWKYKVTRPVLDTTPALPERKVA